MDPRRAKIVCTIGPASRDRLGELIAAGMDVARLNFSHGEHGEYARIVADIRQLARDQGRTVAILQDLQGPKIRTGRHVDGPLQLAAGQTFTITTAEVAGTAQQVSTTYEPLPRDVAADDEILLSDGLLRLVVQKVRGAEVVCEVVNGGVLRERAGINLPGVDLSVPSMTAKDRADLAFGIAQEVDYVALSFVRRAEDMAALQAILKQAPVPIAAVAKLEKPQAIEVLDDIIAVSDAVMVARGDLGVELSPERVPSVQKSIIRAAVQAGKPVITATQMLESMISNQSPTRAEVSDVANAVMDGTDAVMLSAETAVGRFPAQAIETMSELCIGAEKHETFRRPRNYRLEDVFRYVDEAIALAAMYTANHLQVSAIIAFTESGSTPLWMSRVRSDIPIYAFTRHEATRRRVTLYRGVWQHLSTSLTMNQSVSFKGRLRC